MFITATYLPYYKLIDAFGGRYHKTYTQTNQRLIKETHRHQQLFVSVKNVFSLHWHVEYLNIIFLF